MSHTPIKKCWRNRKQLKEDFGNICDWFVENKWSILFGEDKTKFIIFDRNEKITNVRKLIVIFKKIKIKQRSQTRCVGCVLDDTLSVEPMVLIL